MEGWAWGQAKSCAMRMKNKDSKSTRDSRPFPILFFPNKQKRRTPSGFMVRKYFKNDSSCWRHRRHLSFVSTKPNQQKLSLELWCNTDLIRIKNQIEHQEAKKEDTEKEANREQNDDLGNQSTALSSFRKICSLLTIFSFLWHTRPKHDDLTGFRPSKIPAAIRTSWARESSKMLTAHFSNVSMARMMHLSSSFSSRIACSRRGVGLRRQRRTHRFLRRMSRAWMPAVHGGDWKWGGQRG